MRSVLPDAIKASRVYFTEFDRTTYSQVAWTAAEVESIRCGLERKLKLLALVKGHVVIAASHLLESELAHEVFLGHPRLFSEGVIVPALRKEFGGFEGFLDAKVNEGRESERYGDQASRDMAQMLDGCASLVVRWEVNQTSSWFRDRLVNDLEDEKSLLRSCLRAANAIVPRSLPADIGKTASLSRKDVYLLAKATGDKGLWELLCNYADFVYYLSGARAVQSEGVLPQENLMDFTLSDMANGRTRLSEMEVFFKVFVDLVKTATQTHFPVDLLDALSIEDALDLHNVAVEERFVDKYNAIQEKTKEGLTIRDPERLVLLMEELEEFEHQLYREFGDALRAELPRQRLDGKESQTLKFLNATASMLIPWWGATTGARDIVVSGMELAGKGQIASTTQDRIRRHLEAWFALVSRSSSDSSPVLLSFMKKVQQRYADRMLEPHVGDTVARVGKTRRVPHG